MEIKQKIDEIEKEIKTSVKNKDKWTLRTKRFKSTFNYNPLLEATLSATKSTAKLFLDDEIEFLKSDEMKWLIHEADLGSCHGDYKPIIKRLQALQKQRSEIAC